MIAIDSHDHAKVGNIRNKRTKLYQYVHFSFQTKIKLDVSDHRKAKQKKNNGKSPQGQE